MNLSLQKTFYKFLFLTVLLIGQLVVGQVSITSSPYSQNFTIGSSATASLPSGFKFGNNTTDWTAAGNVTATAVAAGTSGTGALTGSSSGNYYNFANGVTASSTDRAIGVLTTGSFSSPRDVFFAFTNNTGSTVTSIDLTFDYEKYRTGTRAWDMTFFHGNTETNINTAATAGNQSYAADGANAVVNPPTTISKTVSLTGLSIPNGTTYYFRWRFAGNGGSTNSQGIGIDNISLTLTSAPSIVVPTVTTTSVSSITTSSASSGGNVTSDGGASVTDRGVAFGTAANPTTGTSDGTGTGTFTSSLTSLSLNTEYFYRAYATNSEGTSYGSELSFYTLAATPGAPVVNNPQLTTLDVTVNSSTENGNPSVTVYAIQETGGQYIQANGTLGATAVWQTAATWGTVTVTGLTASTNYTFQVKARNGANVETAFGTTASGTTLTPETVDYAVVQFPNTTQTITEGGQITVYIRAYENGITTPAGSSTRLKAWVGYSSTNDNPANVGWTWVPATFNVQVGNDDEYQANIGAGLTPGTYYYAARFEIDDSGVFVYGGSSGNWNNNNVTLNVNADVVNFANIQFPTSATITEGATVTVFAQVYEPGVTEGAGQGAGITAEIGYSSTNSSPDGTWTWLSATHNASVTGNNDEYQVNLGTGLTPGTYYYASRFIKTGSSTYVYGGTNGSPWTTSGVLTVNALGTPTATAGTSIGQTQFTANWDAVVGATSYEIDVYTNTELFMSDLIISEYVEGSSNNKYIEIFNGTGNSVDLSDYQLRIYANGSGTPTSNTLTGTLNNNETVVFKNSLATIYSGTALNSSSANFNGDDALAIYKISTDSFVDIFGRIGEDPGTAWTSTSNTTLDRTLVRNTNVLNGISSNPSAGFPTLESEWTQFGIDVVSNLGSHTFNNSSTTFILEDVNVGNVTSYVVTGLNPETTYYYRVRAVLGAATSGNSNEITVITKPTSVTWNGTAWSNIDGPDATIDAIIAGAYATDSDGAFTAKSLTVESGSFTVSAGTNVTVVNEVTNELTAADFVVENNANLIQDNDTNNVGAITVNRNSSALMRLDYTLWSSPVASQNLLSFSPLTMVNRFYVYNPSNNQYAAVTPSSTDFAEGIGYLIRMPDNHPTTATTWSGSFVGVPHNGDVTITVANNSYNAVGNPYPSTIDADDFINDNNLTEALYFWRKTNSAVGSAYATYTLAGGAGTGGSGSSAQVPNGIIQVGQGFIARSTSTSLVFNNLMRVADNNNQFFRSANNVTKSRVWLNLNQENTILGQTMVAYMEGTTTDLDAKFDGKYINDSQTAITSVINNEEYAVQARGEFAATDVVPMTIKLETAGNYTISLAQVDGVFSTEHDIFVRDIELGVEHDIRTAPYSFSAPAGVLTNRFELVYQSTLSVENPTFNNVVVFSKNKALEINSGNETISSVSVFDIRGRKVAAQEEVNTSVVSLDLSGVASQVLIVQIKSTNGQLITKKVVH